MHIVQWHTFALHTSQTKTLVHFFPSAGSMTAPYPAQCKLIAFGQALGVKSVTLDGGRVSQPDGICVDDVFPALQDEKSTAIGLTIEISTMQPRLDIAPSDCVIEFVTEGFSTRFHPYRPGFHPSGSGESGPGTVPIGVMIKDKYTTTSICAMNPSESEAQLHLALLKRNLSGIAEESRLDLSPLPPASIREIPIPESHFHGAFEVSQPYGVQQYLPLIRQGMQDQQVVVYSVYRDASTGCPVSVCAL